MLKICQLETLETYWTILQENSNRLEEEEEAIALTAVYNIFAMNRHLFAIR